MDPTSRLRRVLHPILILVFALGALGCSGETAAPDSAPESTLRQRFPNQAPVVLEQGAAFVATREGFAPAVPSWRGAWNGVEVKLPRDGREAIRIRGFGGVEVRVREIGTQGEGALADR